MMKAICNNADSVMANRSTACERPEHHEKDTTRVEDFTEDKEEIMLIEFVDEPQPPDKTRLEEANERHYHSATRFRTHRNNNTTNSRREHGYNDQ